MGESTESVLQRGGVAEPQSPERRKHVRVMDAVGLEFRARSSDQCDDGTGWRGIPAAMANRYDLQGYATVKRDFPAVANYIDVLEERIRQLQLGGNVLLESPTHKVILSATGIAFAEDRLLQPGDVVPLRITLFPEVQRICCDGTVVSVGDISELVIDTQHSYRMVFSNMSASDAAHVNQHVLSLCKTIRQYTDD